MKIPKATSTPRRMSSTKRCKDPRLLIDEIVAVVEGDDDAVIEEDVVVDDEEDVDESDVNRMKRPS